MGACRSLVVLAAGAAIGGALLLAYRVSQETGKGLPEALTHVPAEAQRLFADLRGRADQAMERGREAYHEKQTDIEEHLRDSTQPR
jgi:uncharacterized protein (DUF58 family)